MMKIRLTFVAILMFGGLYGSELDDNQITEEDLRVLKKVDRIQMQEFCKYYAEKAKNPLLDVSGDGTYISCMEDYYSRKEDDEEVDPETLEKVFTKENIDAAVEASKEAEVKIDWAKRKEFIRSAVLPKTPIEHKMVMRECKKGPREFYRALKIRDVSKCPPSWKEFELKESPAQYCEREIVSIRKGI
jgi:hypothetical protein